MSYATSDTLVARLQTIDNKVMFSASARENQEIVIDYFPPLGTGNGYTSLELFMLSFGSCVGSTLITLLRYRMKKNVDGIDIEIKGTVRQEHPKALEHILLLLKIKAKDLTKIEAMEALNIVENTMCPVWAMIKGNVAVDVEIEINE